MPYVIADGKAKIAPGFVEKAGKASPVQDAKNYLINPSACAVS